MTPAQCKMARTGLGISASLLAIESGVSRVTIARYESTRPIASDSVDKIRSALESMGAIFTMKAGRVAVSVPNALLPVPE